MFCSQCGKENPDDGVFCESCGARLKDESVTTEQSLKSQTSSANSYGPSAQSYQSLTYQSPEVPQDVKNYAKDVFIEPDEELLGTLGDGWLINLMFGRLRKCNALLTNKRLYLQGQVFMGDGSLKNLAKGTMEYVLDVRYITGTYFEYTKKVGTLIWAIISTLGVLISMLGCFIIWPFWICLYPAISLSIPSIILFIKYFTSRKCYFRIDFGYGFTKSLKINASILGIAHVKDFERQVIRAKAAARADIERRFEQRS